MTTIRRRLTIWYTVALGATIVAFGALLYAEQRQSSMRDLDEDLTFQANVAVRRLADWHETQRVLTQVTDSGLALQPELSAELEGLPGYLIVTDRVGNVIGISNATARLTSDAQKHLKDLLATDGKPDQFGTAGLGLAVGQVRYLKRDVREAGPEVGTVLVAASMSRVTLAPASLLRSMLFITPVVMASALVVGYWLARTSLRPLESITEELEAITDGRSLHRRVAAPFSGDELTRLVLTMNGMLARLEESFVNLHRFTADASHELKTPLMVLRAGVERALTHPRIPPELLQALDDTLAQINAMSEMVESLLTLARANEGKMPLAVQECDLRELLTDIAETAGILGDEAGIAVTVELPEHPVRISVDRHRIREMLLNLVTNAIKYTPHGGSVGLTLGDDEQTVTLTVRDTGIGIAPGDLPHIFERFWRADPARSRTGQRPGAGLGLAITKWIAEAHGGAIVVQSRPGRGTLFTITLPKKPTALQDA